MQNSIKSLSANWSAHLKKEWGTEHFRGLKKFLAEQKKLKVQIYPKESEYFTAFNLTPFNKVKVVILGQDPYYGEGQAHGLSFSVLPGIKVPPSLLNIYKELQSDVGMDIPDSGFLEGWAKQGVLLLNATLSVEAGKAGSHQKKGWESFTDSVIKLLNEKKSGLVFMLWGSYAQKKGKAIDAGKHLVLKAPHPSPLSSYRGFFGCKHFSKANEYLLGKGKVAINWEKIN